MSPVHVPILLGPIVESLTEPLRALPEEEPSHWIVDCTLGGGGHVSGFLRALEAEPKLRRHRVLGVDQDERAIEAARRRFATEITEGRLELLHSRFSEIGPALAGKPVIGILADLGFSSDQIEDPERGLSFNLEGPLDMRLDPARKHSARDVLSRIREDDLADLIFELGEERFSRKIAAAIIHSRSHGGLPATTTALAELIARAVPPAARHGRIHPATRTFQALRIAVNEELDELESLLQHVILSLKPGGRVAILSFHSLEDRKVKQVFKPRDAMFRQLTKKPIEAGEEEVRLNPRSRSAKLRIAERVA